MITTHAEILAELGIADLASALGEKPETVRKWKARDSIPAEQWLGVVSFAQSLGKTHINADLLAKAAAFAAGKAA